MIGLFYLLGNVYIKNEFVDLGPHQTRKSSDYPRRWLDKNMFSHIEFENIIEEL